MTEKEKQKHNDEKIKEAILNGLIDCRDAPDLGWSNFGGINIDNCIAWLKKQDKQTKQVHCSKFTFDDVLALQCCMETVKKVQEDKELYERLNLIHSKMYDAYQIETQDEQASSQNNKNIDLTKILKDCPKGTKLYSTIFGDVEFCHVDESNTYPIKLSVEGECDSSVTADGKHYVEFGGECTLFPSREQRDWSKFTAPWYKKEKFDPKTLQPFNRVLVSVDGEWQCDFFSHMLSEDIFNKRCMGVGDMNIVIPYNDDTKHLVGTTEEAPEYYRYWED